MAENPGISYIARGEIDVAQVTLDAAVPLRIAAVRDGEVLASHALEAPARRGKISYELRFPLPFPCGFHLLLGRADVPDRVLLGNPLAEQSVAPRLAERGKAAAGAATAATNVTVQAEPFVLDQAVYRIWLAFCRRHRVTGRVVCRHWRWDGHFFRFCDDPVPGATVEIYDVDCFWIWCTKDLITTAVTGADGRFEADFWWCCPIRLPFFTDAIALETPLLERLQRLIDELRLHLHIPIPDPPPDPARFDGWLTALSAALESEASGRVQRAVGERLADTALAQRLPSPELTALHVWPWWPQRDCFPDILIRATQDCHGVKEVIYEESIASTRWDVPGDLTVTLVTNGKACCIPICEGYPCGDCFKFGEVGCTPVASIGGNDPLSPVGIDLLGVAYPGSADLLFARTLAVTGTLGSMADFDYYEIEASTDSGATFSPLPSETLGAIPRIFWGPPCGGGVAQWNYPAFPAVVKQDAALTSHWVYETRARYQNVDCPGAWENPLDPSSRWWTTNRDLALLWNTVDLSTFNPGVTESPFPSVPDGLYYLRVVGYKLDAANHLVDRQVLLRCDTADEERLIIRIDNRQVPNHAPSVPSHPWGPGFVHIGSIDPDCNIVSMVKNEGSGASVPILPCDIVGLSDADTLTVHFFVTAPGANTDRHLGGYWMTVEHGLSATFDAIAASLGAAPQPDPTPHVGPSYNQAVLQGEARPWWGGGSYKLVLPGSAFPETCAYLFRLHAYKRVDSGCGGDEWFHSNDTEFSITLQKV